jgi:hypothetical protein
MDLGPAKGDAAVRPAPTGLDVFIDPTQGGGCEASRSLGLFYFALTALKTIPLSVAHILYQEDLRC